MTIDEFRDLVEAWGADIARWPEHLRMPAAQLARRPDAAAILAEAERFDRLITAARPTVSADRVGQAILNVVTLVAAHGPPAGFQRMSLWQRWLVLTASLATAAALGVSLGLMKPLNALGRSNDTAMLTRVLDSGSFGPDWVLQ